MTPLHLVLSILAVLSLDYAWSSPVCHDQCCRFVEGFPVRLKKLREDFSQIRGYYEANDDLDTALLDQNVENYLKSQFGCHAMKSILDFYLQTVFPTAMAGDAEETREFRPYMESIKLIFDKLKDDFIRCRNYFSCKKPFDIKDLNSTYTQMESRGLFKAMGELDLFFNYIEAYLASKRRRQ